MVVGNLGPIAVIARSLLGCPLISAFLLGVKVIVANGEKDVRITRNREPPRPGDGKELPKQAARGAARSDAG